MRKSKKHTGQNVVLKTIMMRIQIWIIYGIIAMDYLKSSGNTDYFVKKIFF